MANIFDEAKQLARRIAAVYKPQRIILFGSVARGQAKPTSDIDLLIIKDSPEKRPFRIKKIFEAIRGILRNYPLDPIVYTPQELERRQKLGDPFLKNVFEEGRVLYE